MSKMSSWRVGSAHTPFWRASPHPPSTHSPSIPLLVPTSPTGTSYYSVCRPFCLQSWKTCSPNHWPSLRLPDDFDCSSKSPVRRVCVCVVMHLCACVFCGQEHGQRASDDAQSSVFDTASEYSGIEEAASRAPSPASSYGGSSYSGSRSGAPALDTASRAALLQALAASRQRSAPGPSVSSTGRGASAASEASAPGTRSPRARSPRALSPRARSPRATAPAAAGQAPPAQAPPTQAPPAQAQEDAEAELLFSKLFME